LLEKALFFRRRALPEDHKDVKDALRLLERLLESVQAAV
jgi:hypothetical protein